jgi:hypothetical protein
VVQYSFLDTFVGIWHVPVKHWLTFNILSIISQKTELFIFFPYWNVSLPHKDIEVFFPHWNTPELCHRWTMPENSNIVDYFLLTEISHCSECETFLFSHWNIGMYMLRCNTESVCCSLSKNSKCMEEYGILYESVIVINLLFVPSGDHNRSTFVILCKSLMKYQLCRKTPTMKRITPLTFLTNPVNCRS